MDAYDCSHYADLREALRVLAKRMKRTTLRSFVSLLAFALGASVGTFLWPGKGTLVGEGLEFLVPFGRLLSQSQFLVEESPRNQACFLSFR